MARVIYEKILTQHQYEIYPSKFYIFQMFMQHPHVKIFYLVSIIFFFDLIGINFILFSIYH